MQAIEFETSAQDDLIKIPENYKDWYNQSFKVILIATEEKTECSTEEEIRRFYASRKLHLGDYKFDREEANAR